MSTGMGGDGDAADVEERELTQFAQVDDFLRLLLSDDFYPGGLEQRPVQLEGATSDGERRHREAKGEESMRRLTGILDEYQEQSYLLDPHLEAIVVPAVRALQELVRKGSSSDGDAQLLASSAPIQRLTALLYHYTKVRGYKTIIHFFPHAVEDLLPTLALLEQYQRPSVRSSWEIRYILLLWLSLICMIPFDLVRFDETATTPQQGSTARRIQSIGCHFLAQPGKERDAAAVMLGKLFQRKDASQDQFEAFLLWARETLLADIEPSIFLATGILQTLCSVVKSLSPQALEPHVTALRSLVALYSCDAEEVSLAANGKDDGQPFHFCSNSLVNKYKAKMACRLGLKALRPRKRERRLRAKVLGEPGEMVQSLQQQGQEEEEEEGEEVPEQVDAYIATLMDALQDRDTVIRYSAAKGLSRLCSRLPPSFVDQVSDAVTDLFSVNVSDLLGKKQDLSNVSEFTWQGCCLALAELARRGLLAGDGLSEKLEWVEKALMFDVRRGAHSVGTGVRDAACYVLWAMARAHDAESVRPMARRLSHQLVCVALLDRDISIRRAASAAFQECVGRLSLFEHGIDIIRKTDFYAVGVRRNAFLECAPMVAVHSSYRRAILDHLLSTTIVHWDPAMRQVGALAVAKVARADLASLAPAIIEQLTLRCRSGDAALLHGTLSTLAELSAACQESKEAAMQGWCTTIFASLDIVPRHAIRALGPSMVMQSACQVIAASATIEALQKTSPGKGVSHWNDFIQAALKRREESVQTAASQALAAVSRLIDCSERIRATISEWKSQSVNEQQGNARALGVYDYGGCGPLFTEATTFLLSLVRPGSSHYSTNVETRRNACASLVDAIVGLGGRVDDMLDGAVSRQVFQALLDGFDDYTKDARGDVGSWVRLACLAGIRRLFSHLNTSSTHGLAFWLDQDLFDALCGGYCKQMVERIDAVRTQAAIECLALVQLCTPAGGTEDLAFPGSSVFERLFARESDLALKDPTWLLPRVVQLLLVAEYRSEVLKGVVLCIGGQKELSNRIVSRSLSAFLLDQEERRQSYGPTAFVDNVVALAGKNIKSNRYFVPAMQTLNVLFEEGVMDVVMEEEGGRASLSKALEMACRNADVIKSIVRVMAAMQYTMHMLAVASLRPPVLARLSVFLLHPFPTVRSSAAESLYSSVQDNLDDVGEEIEEMILSTRWAHSNPTTLQPTVKHLIDLLS